MKDVMKNCLSCHQPATMWAYWIVKGRGPQLVYFCNCPNSKQDKDFIQRQSHGTLVLGMVNQNEPDMEKLREQNDSSL